MVLVGLVALALFLIVLIIAAYVIWVYNKLVRLRERVHNAWAQIDVQLKRRADLIPNLVEVVKGYAKHERELLEKITALRTSIVNGTPRQRLEANEQLSNTLKTLFAVVENYPDLKANVNFLELQRELATTEDKISYVRHAFNDLTYQYNTSIKQFPDTLVARLLGFKEEEYFEVENERERQTPQVKF